MQVRMQGVRSAVKSTKSKPMDKKLEDLIAELKKWSNLDYCQSAEDLQEALEIIHYKLNVHFPEIKEKN